MPHITVQMFPGRDDGKKRELAGRLAETAARVLGVPEALVSVSIRDVSEEDWDEKVYDVFMREKEFLYRGPDYGAE